ncbi:hypothetical protein Hypma_012944 [Hypsizygus marmoreus]|uniref:Uncharacterized protein n=1 Tax=Hypsizygus marmoreus TaxID=39966 RepID=A0A369JCU9_HYPMA|nr:hypothetical protein Hypma_012944 [Hypsizygus marmoreus]
MATPSFRRTHRKRVSALRLSSDTTTTLPEYITVGAWRREDDPPSDRPPDYPDSAEEADEDTDSDGNPSSVYVPPLSPSGHISPRRARRFAPHRRRQVQSSNDPYLDSLLARSVHALEMSNTLLQSSISTQPTLSSILASDSRDDEMLETTARGLSARIHGSRDVHAAWADDLEEISRGVEGLFDDEPRSRVNRHAASSSSADATISSSLPTSRPVSQFYRQRQRPSLLDLRDASAYKTPQLHLSQQDRSDLVSPPPRALTQYVASTDADILTLPSTLGLRVPSSSHPSSDWRPLAEASTSSLHAPLSSPQLTDRPVEPSTPAYNMLSSFVSRAPSPGSSTPSSFSSSRPSFLSSSRRSSRNTSASTERSDISSRSSPSKVGHKSPESSRTIGLPSDRSSRSITPKQIITALPHRPMTPPTEESSCSSDGCAAKLTILSLRKILDEQPAPPPPPASQPLRRPTFLPRTPAPVAEASTSTATASVSRLFTKAKHSSSTRPSSPPRQSALKQSSRATTPSPSPTTLSIPDLLGAGVARALGSSASSSGRSTPKRISFAELPESYADSRPGGSSSKFRDKKKRREKHASGKGKERDESDSGGGWWTSWLVGGSASSTSRHHEERTEDRLTRSWGGRMSGAGFGSGLDEWAM